MNIGKKKSGKKAIGIAMAAIMLASIFATIIPTFGVPVPTGDEGIYYLDPAISNAAQQCTSTDIDVWVNSSIPIRGGSVLIETSDQTCGNITGCAADPLGQWPGGLSENCVIGGSGKSAKISFNEDMANTKPVGNYLIGTITVHCTSSTSCCLANLSIIPEIPDTYITNTTGNDFGVTGENGVFVCGDPINVTKTVKDPTTGLWVPSYSFPMGDEAPGVNVTFNITVHAKCCNLANVAVTDVLDSGLAYANSATVNGVPCEPQVSGQTLTWSYNAGACQNNFTDLDICNKKYIEFNATVTEYGEHTNSATATGWCNEFAMPVLVSNTSEAWVNLPSPARIEVIKTVWDPIKQQWVKAITKEIDYLNIGDLASEQGHDLQGWSDNQSGVFTGSNYGGGDDGTFRLLLGPGDGCTDNHRNASFTMNTGAGTANQIELRNLDGSQNDNFTVYIREDNGSLTEIGEYLHSTPSEDWVTSTFDFPERQGTITFVLNSTGTITTWCDTWGQVAFSWAKLNTDRAKICETYRFNCTIHNDGSEGLDLTNIEVWDIMTDSLEYEGNATIMTPDGITRDINPPTYLSNDKTRFNWTINDYLQAPLTLQPCQCIFMEFDAHIVNYCNNSNTQYAKGQTSEGIWVYDNDTAWINIPKPDLNVSDITINYGASGIKNLAIGPRPGLGVKTQCNNISALIEEDNNVTVAFPFNVTFKNNGNVLCTETVPAGMPGKSTRTIYCDCCWEPMAGDIYNISVTVDTGNVIRESDETNNTMWDNGTAIWNGYKGDGYQGPDMNLTSVQCHDQDTINLTYSIGDSYYAGGNWSTTTEYVVNWTTSDLPIPPEETCIKKAWLYVYYTWDKEGVMPTGVNLTFNGDTIPLARDYSDSKGFGTSYPYGMLVYDVQPSFHATTGNTAILTKQTAETYIPIKGMLLMVVYNHPDEPERIICIDEGYDMLAGGGYALSAYGVTPEEATTYATFECCEPIPLNKIGKATLVTVAPGASKGDDKNRLSFNDGLWKGAWSGFAGSTELGIAETDVLDYLKEENNVAGFQDRGDWMEASNAFLVLEKGKATIEVVDPPECVGVGEQFDVPINVTPDNAAVYGVEYVIEFNASVIHAEWQNEGNFLKRDGASTNVYRNVIDNVNGKLEFAVTRVAPPPTGATVPGTLAIIHFTAIEQGATTTVNLTHVKATDSEAQTVYVVKVNSTVEVCDNTPPTADGKSRFKHNNVGAKYLSTTYFDGSASSDDPDGYITYYRWWFGDGNDGVGETAEHVYGSFKWNVNSYDPFNVSLTVQDDGTPILDDTDYLDVNVYMAGDTNGDGEVDIVDGSIVGLEFWEVCSGDNWGSADRKDMADLNNDCEVDIIDASIVGVTFWDTAW